MPGTILQLHLDKWILHALPTNTEGIVSSTVESANRRARELSSPFLTAFVSLL
jgi:hypothetical protein